MNEEDIEDVGLSKEEIAEIQAEHDRNIEDVRVLIENFCRLILKAGPVSMYEISLALGQVEQKWMSLVTTQADEVKPEDQHYFDV